MKFKVVLLSIILLFLISSKANSQPHKNITQLAKTEQWRALLHINLQTEADELESYVDDVSFFLAIDGAKNPENELLATIASLKKRDEIQCKFPARTLFLFNNVKGLREEVKPYVCQEYLDWRSTLKTTNVVLVFASAQLNSPSSMYGHTFLRFDPDNVEQNSTYLSYALNFGATVPEGEGGFLYAARGLTGGYPGYFAANPYFEKIKEYSRLENRDLWEYKLNLTQEEINTMLAHIWELQGISFEYYFFDENCSFRLLELLDVARPGLNLAKNFPVTAMPLDTVRVVQEANLITETNYRPSILTELKAQLAMLNTEENELALALSQEIEVLNSEEFIKLNKKQQQRIVDSAYRYLRYQNTFNGRPKETTRRSFLLLRRLNENRTKLNIPIEQPHRPDLGHKTAMFGFSLGQNLDKSFAEIKYRGSYHDLLDPISGYYTGMSLNMVNAMVRVYEGGDVKLEKAELLDIISLSARNDYFSPWSWKANISVEQQWTKDKEVLVTQGSGGGGVSYQPLENSYVFLLATGRLEFNRKLDTYAAVAPGLQLGFLYYWPKTTLLVDAEHYQFLFDQTQRSRVSVEQSVGLGQNDSVRFSANFHRVESNTHDNKSFQEFKLEYRHYF
ncbi:Lnb N-terminal periplasmic domain-containing protein [Colwellia sp. Bg11-28]|uniref:Lnb N-terminal periplasmic domain-containing protein n=1 Tax=Colwellia sp. Bg11-28 TaxID=2058305 RepID=UPI000C34B166|nr:DUF4105 domain-containing protein [Colwellia sp. Bg11-28]PKH87440.1 hypothetical protein CXF79_12345 [Colwellia sp. Bg11-28]